MNSTATHAGIPRKPRLAADPAEEQTPAARALGSDVFLSLFVACYNESGNIVGTLETVVAAASKTVPSYEIVVVDDGSRDSSVAEVREFMAARPDLPIRLLINPRNEGVANNYAEAAFRSHGEWYRMICGDNVESEETLATIFSSIGEAEVLLYLARESDQRQPPALLQRHATHAALLRHAVALQLARLRVSGRPRDAAPGTRRDL
jgi:glycosyltransferase involved in cell wall biosynthesis